jgi:hypothetical protein
LEKCQKWLRLVVAQLRSPLDDHRARKKKRLRLSLRRNFKLNAQLDTINGYKGSIAGITYIATERRLARVAFAQDGRVRSLHHLRLIRYKRGLTNTLSRPVLSPARVVSHLFQNQLAESMACDFRVKATFCPMEKALSWRELRSAHGDHFSVRVREAAEGIQGRFAIGP